MASRLGYQFAPTSGIPHHCRPGAIDLDSRRTSGANGALRDGPPESRRGFLPHRVAHIYSGPNYIY
jgi:hypothetical protein